MLEQGRHVVQAAPGVCCGPRLGHLNIAFDGYWWVSGPPSGRMIVRELLRAWTEVFPQHSLSVFVPSWDVERARGTLPPGVRVVPAVTKPHGIAASVEMCWRARQDKADVLLTQNFAPMFGPSAVFVHDALFVTNPEWFTRTERVYLAPIGPLLRRADAVMTSSECEAARIRSAFGLRSTVSAVGLAPASALVDADETPPQGLEDLSDFGLSVGRLNVRKNLATTLEAASAASAFTQEHPLIVVGERDGRQASLSQNARDAISERRIRLVGGVSDAELKWLYRRARVFVYLSLDEGFGLPPLEALHFGCEVVVSDIPVFHETLGGRAEFVPPEPAAVTAAIDAIYRRAPGPRVRPTPISPHQDWADIVGRTVRVLEGVAR